MFDYSGKPEEESSPVRGNREYLSEKIKSLYVAEVRSALYLDIHKDHIPNAYSSQLFGTDLKGCPVLYYRAE